MEKPGEIDRKRVLLNLMARKPLPKPKPTPLKGKPLDAIEEAVPWRKGEVIQQKGGMGEDYKYVKAKARPKPADEEEAKKDEAPMAEVVAEIINVEGDDEKKSPKRGAILTNSRWGKLKEEKKKRDMAKAPWTKTGRKETTTAQYNII